MKIGGVVTGGPTSNCWPVLMGAVTTMSSEGFSSPPNADHTSANARSSGGGKTHGQGYGEPGFRQLANHELVRQGFVLEE